MLLIAALMVPWVTQAQSDCTPISTFPVTYGFEASEGFTTTVTAAAACTTNVFNSCWRNEQTSFSGSTGSGRIWHIYGGTTATYLHSGAHSLMLPDKGSSTAGVSTTMLTFPAMNFTNPGGYIVTFWIQRNGTSTNPEGFKIYVSDTDTIGPNAVELGHYSRNRGIAYPCIESATGWYQYETAPITMTGTVYIIFEGQSYYGSSTYVDDITIMEAPTCPRVDSLSVVASTNDAVVSWVETGSATDWEVTVSDATSVVSSTIVSSIPATISNLDGNTQYTVDVRAVCGIDDTSMVRSTTFRTLCTDISTLPYSYGFDDLATGSSTVRPVIPCWHHLNNGTSSFGYPYVSSTNHTGGRSLYWYGSTTTGTYGDYQIVVLPGVDTNIYPINTLQLHFWARPSSTSYSPVFQVGVMTDPTDATTFQNVQTVNVQNVTTWQEFTVMFDTYTGAGQYIAVRMNRPSSSLYAYTDDFTLSVAPSCAPIVSHHVTATASAARITWTRDPGFATDPAGYEVSYSFASNTASATTVSTTDPELTLTGLDPDSAYTVTINSDCGDSYSPDYTFNFTTMALPCIEWDTTGNVAAGPTDTLTVGTPGTSTTAVMPVNNDYNYSYTQHLILPSHVSLTGATTISGIAFDYAYSQPMTHATNCQIYMGNTTRSTFTVSSPADSAFVPYSDLTLVYQGPLNCTTNGYNYFQFNQGVFQYDGTSNIVVAIVNNSGSYDGTSYVFRYETTSEATGGAMTHRVYNNTTPYGPTEMNAARANQSYWRTNMKLVTGGGGDCLTQATCVAPAVSIEQENTGNYLLSWVPGYQETSWDVDYRVTGTATWTNVVSGTSNTDYTFLSTDLQSNTHYEFRVTALCSDTNIATTLAYTTPCGMIDAVPFTENFDTYGAGTTVFPSCWYKLGSTADRPYINSSTTYGHNNTYGLYFYAVATGYCYAIMPRVNTTILNLNTLQVSFWARQYSTSYNCDFEVGVMTDPTNASTFTAISSVHPAGTTYESFEVPLSSYTGTGSYIAFRAIQHPGSSTAIYMMLDDVTLENAPACPRVTNVQAGNITQNDATISWTATNANEYEVQYGPAGFTLGTGAIEIGITDDSVALTGLTANTPYDVYVRGICTDDTSNWSFVYTFRTACGILDSLPFTEDFENQPTGTSSTGSPFIPCWTRLNNGTSYPGYPYVSSSSTYNHTQGGTQGLYWYGSTTTGTYGDYQYIILPQIDTTVYPINTLQLGFWAKASSTSYNPVFQVGVMNSATDTAMTVLGTVNINGNTEWTEYITNLSSYQGFGGRFVAIRALRPSSAWYAYVDDITLELVPPCPRVEDLHAINATLDSITIVWTDTSSTNTSWVVEYDSVDFIPGSGDVTPIIVTDTFYHLEGLDSATTYHIYVYPPCNDYVGYRHITAATLAASPASVPYTCDFEENGPNGWDFFNDGQTNYWIVGSNTSNGGTQSMYITNDGTTNAYNTSTISYSYAIRTFNLSEPGEYAYSYDWKGTGESHYYDFTRVFVTPASEMFTAGDVLGGSTYAFSTAAAPASWIELTQSGETPNTLAQQSTWTT
ncbi:MAG: fibronectin type III domain-containing protein, partial [Bacteroidales bacterium]|nr:fibronectin type III domain-containing protein [Bacteroidales bacterium]